jgi:potassium efflux system protein
LGVLIVVLIVGGAVVLARGDAHAQRTTTATAQTESKPAAVKPRGPEPIPPSQISIKSEETAEVLRSLRERPEPDPAIDEIRKLLPAAMGELQDLLSETENRLKGTVSTRTLEDLERRWSRQYNRIEGWQSTVNRRAHALDRDLETLQKLRASWYVTRENAREAGLQEALLDVVNESLRSIGEVEDRFGSRRSEVLTVQGQVDEAVEIVHDARDQIEKARNKTQLKLLNLDAPPLWELIIHPPPRAQHWRNIVAAREQTWRDLREFLVEYRNSLIAHAVLFLVLTVVLLLIKRRARAVELEGPELAASARVVSRPVSTAATLWLLLTLILFPQAPRLIDELVTLVLFIPLFRILPARVTARMPGLLAALVVANVFGRFVEMLSYMSPLYRLALLLETLLCLTFVVASLRRTRAAPGERPSAALRLIRIIQWIAILYLSAAAVSNVVGNVSFAGTVTRAVYLSAYLGLALYAIYYVVAGVVRLLLRSRFLRHLKMVRRHQQLILERILTLLRIGLFVLWLVSSLKAMQVFEPVFDAIVRVLTAQARFGDVGISLGGILSFAVTVWAAFILSRFLRFVLEEDVYPRLALPRGVPTAISIGVHYLLLLFGFFLALAATGADLGKTTILAGAFGVGVGFGLQDIVHNFISGLILIVERPVLPGDTVQIDTLYGEVKRIGLRSSTVRTWEGAEVIVPNGKLISSQVVNWTLSDRQRRLDIHVGVEYGTDPDRVIELLVEAGSRHPGLLEHPEPVALFVGFGDFTMDFQLRVWTAESGFLKIKSELTVAVNRALNDAGIRIPVPQRDLRVTMSGPGELGDLPATGNSDEM